MHGTWILRAPTKQMVLEVRAQVGTQATTLSFVALQLREIHAPGTLRFYE